MHEQLHQPTGYTLISQETGVAAAVNFDTRQATSNVAVYSQQERDEGRVHQVSPPNKIVAEASRVATRAATSYVEAVQSQDTEEYKEAQRVRAEQRLKEREANEQRKRDRNRESLVTETVRLDGDRTYRLRPATTEQIEQVSARGSRRAAAAHNRLILDTPADDQNIDTRRLRVKLRVTDHQEDISVPDETVQDGFRIEQVPAGTAILHRKGRIDLRVALGNGQHGEQRYRIDRERVDQTVILADRDAVNNILAANPPTAAESQALREEIADERQAEWNKLKWLGLIAAGTLLLGAAAELLQSHEPQGHANKPGIHDTRGQGGSGQPAGSGKEQPNLPHINLTAYVQGTELWTYEARQLNQAEPGLQAKDPAKFNNEVLAWVRASEDMPQNLESIQNYRAMPNTEGFVAYTAQAIELFDQAEQPNQLPNTGNSAALEHFYEWQTDAVSLAQNIAVLEQTPIAGDGLNDQTDARNPIIKTAAKKFGDFLKKLSQLASPRP